MSDIPFQSTPKTDAEYQEVIAQMFAEMEQINAQMRQTQAEIDRLRAESDACRAQSDRLWEQGRHLDEDIRARLKHLHETLDKMGVK